jgi:hypothetical protein
MLQVAEGVPMPVTVALAEEKPVAELLCDAEDDAEGDDDADAEGDEEAEEVAEATDEPVAVAEPELDADCEELIVAGLLGLLLGLPDRDGV